MNFTDTYEKIYLHLLEKSENDTYVMSPITNDEMEANGWLLCDLSNAVNEHESYFPTIQHKTDGFLVMSGHPEVLYQKF